MKSLPHISVIMPTFEQSHLIRRALGRLLAQWLQDWELIIVDDGSEDLLGHLCTCNHPVPALTALLREDMARGAA